MVRVVLARGNLEPGTRLSPDTVEVKAIPAAYVHSLAVKTDADLRAMDGQMLTSSVKKGDLILKGMWGPPKPPSFSMRVETGHRAMTVAVDEINSISGMLEPGDLIDLLVTVDIKGRKSTFPLLQRVTVMATGQRAVDDPRSGERRTFSTVTLDTDMQQAQNIIVAREAGKLTALLRNPKDTQPIQGEAVDLMAVLNDKGRPPDAEVPVLYGGRGGRFPPEGLHLGRYITPGKGATPRVPLLADANDASAFDGGAFTAGPGAAPPSLDRPLNGAQP
jgi:pilus assembly protein CpaB